MLGQQEHTGLSLLTVDSTLGVTVVCTALRFTFGFGTGTGRAGGVSKFDKDEISDWGVASPGRGTGFRGADGRRAGPEEEEAS